MVTFDPLDCPGKPYYAVCLRYRLAQVAYRERHALQAASGPQDSKELAKNRLWVATWEDQELGFALPNQAHLLADKALPVMTERFLAAWRAAQSEEPPPPDPDAPAYHVPRTLGNMARFFERGTGQ